MANEPSLEGMTPEVIASLAQLAKGLSDNPKTRTKFLELTKEANPDMSIPEIDVPRHFESALQKERDARTALERQILTESVERSVRERRANLKEKHGFKDSDITELETLMVDKGIQSHDTAAEFMMAQRKSATPTPSVTGMGSHQMPEVDTKQFGGNIQQWARSTAMQTINDIRSGAIKV
jgi:hypothetical protein